MSAGNRRAGAQGYQDSRRPVKVNKPAPQPEPFKFEFDPGKFTGKEQPCKQP